MRSRTDDKFSSYPLTFTTVVVTLSDSLPSGWRCSKKVPIQNAVLPGAAHESSIDLDAAFPATPFKASFSLEYTFETESERTERLSILSRAASRMTGRILAATIGAVVAFPGTCGIRCSVPLPGTETQDLDALDFISPAIPLQRADRCNEQPCFRIVIGKVLRNLFRGDFLESILGQAPATMAVFVPDRGHVLDCSFLIRGVAEPVSVRVMDGGEAEDSFVEVSSASFEARSILHATLIHRIARAVYVSAAAVEMQPQWRTALAADSQNVVQQISRLEQRLSELDQPQQLSGRQLDVSLAEAKSLCADIAHSHAALLALCNRLLFLTLD